MDQNRLVWLDGLRLIASLSMVGLHATADINGQPFPDVTPLERTGPVILRSFMYLARTELFLIISLFLLFMSLDHRPRGYWPAIVEQSKRLMRPFLFWVVFYAFYRLIKAQYFGYDAAIWTELGTPLDWIGYIVLGDVQYHMHFLPTLFALVLLFPVCLIAVKAPWTGLIILICLFVKREADIWLWAHADHIPAHEYFVRFVKVLTYLGYGYVGAAAYGIYKRSDGLRTIAPYFKVILLTAVLLYVLKFVYSLRVIETGDWQFNYTPGFWTDFLMPVLLFALFMAWPRMNKLHLISKLAPYGFGIYLVHPIFLDMAEIALWDRNLTPMSFVLMKILWAVPMAALFTLVLSKITLLGWTVGLRPFPECRWISRFMQPNLR